MQVIFVSRESFYREVSLLVREREREREREIEIERDIV